MAKQLFKMLPIFEDYRDEEKVLRKWLWKEFHKLIPREESKSSLADIKAFVEAKDTGKSFNIGRAIILWMLLNPWEHPQIFRIHKNQHIKGLMAKLINACYEMDKEYKTNISKFISFPIKTNDRSEPYFYLTYPNGYIQKVGFHALDNADATAGYTPSSPLAISDLMIIDEPMEVNFDGGKVEDDEEFMKKLSNNAKNIHRYSYGEYLLDRPHITELKDEIKDKYGIILKPQVWIASNANSKTHSIITDWYDQYDEVRASNPKVQEQLKDPNPKVRGQVEAYDKDYKMGALRGLLLVRANIKVNENFNEEDINIRFDGAINDPRADIEVYGLDAVLENSAFGDGMQNIDTQFLMELEDGTRQDLTNTIPICATIDTGQIDKNVGYILGTSIDNPFEYIDLIDGMEFNFNEDQKNFDLRAKEFIQMIVDLKNTWGSFIYEVDEITGKARKEFLVIVDETKGLGINTFETQKRVLEAELMTRIGIVFKSSAPIKAKNKFEVIATDMSGNEIDTTESMRYRNAVIKHTRNFMETGRLRFNLDNLTIRNFFNKLPSYQLETAQTPEGQKYSVLKDNGHLDYFDAFGYGMMYYKEFRLWTEKNKEDWILPI